MHTHNDVTSRKRNAEPAIVLYPYRFVLFEDEAQICGENWFDIDSPHCDVLIFDITEDEANWLVDVFHKAGYHVRCGEVPYRVFK